MRRPASVIALRTDGASAHPLQAMTMAFACVA
jgi:hypothetical protein